MLRRLRRPFLAFGLTALLGATVTYGVYQAETARGQSDFDRQLSDIAARITRRIAQDAAFLTATRSLFATREGELLSRAAFADYVRGLGLTGPDAGLQGVGFARLVPPEAEAPVVARMQQDYGPGRQLWPAPDQGPPRSAIVLLEPANDRNLAAIGYDMMTEPRRRAAMTVALADPGRPVASAPVTLVQEIGEDKQAGFLLFLFSAGHSGGAPAGFVYSPIRAGELFQAALDAVETAPDLIAVDTAMPDEPLFRTPGYRDRDPRHRSAVAQIEVGGRSWLLTAQSRSGDAILRRYPFTLVTAVGMGLLALTTALAVQGLSAAVRRARSLNAAQAQLMREKDLHLREMSHRIKNSLTRVTAMARQAARGAESKEDFVASMTRRLQAMANAQDMLTRSASGQAGLRQLLASELGQIMGDEAVRPAMDGPDVLLDARETQALGLSFHELATNCLKYGAGAVEGGRLEIRWSVSPVARGGRMLTLVWNEETGKPAEETDHRGFGSQLLDSCIRMELGGSITREWHDRGMTAEIRVPLAAPAGTPPQAAQS